MKSLDKLCFVLVERQKANKLRRKYLGRFYSAKRKLAHHYRCFRPHAIKSVYATTLTELSKDSRESYRRVADLMNAQRPLLKQLRKENNAKMEYNSLNHCIGLMWNNVHLTWKDITVLANQYAFESIVLKESTFENPYAKELYGKETKQEENNSTN